ncbi:MAG: hypothetical protein HRT35_01405 [Algicola sp.]|nr:hypothetical protein [Algicola sp.]
MRTNLINGFKQIILTVMLVASTNALAGNPVVKSAPATFKFNDNEQHKFLDQHKTAIKTITTDTLIKMRKLMPTLASSIQFTINIIDRDLSMVNGTTGRADRPNEIEISLSSRYKGGLDQVIKDGFAVTLFHELHHTVRGWTIYGNKFDQGIDIATINEGLADVFAEIQAGHPHGNYTDVVDFEAWTKEILALPKNANYGKWMFAHPDGREAIGYRTGAYLVKKAMKASNKDILALSKMSIKAIYKLAGFEFTP